LNLSPQIYEKYPNIKFHENQSSWSRVLPYGRTDTRTGGRPDGRTDRQTDRLDEANISSSQFCERANILHAEITRYDVVPIYPYCIVLRSRAFVELCVDTFTATVLYYNKIALSCHF